MKKILFVASLFISSCVTQKYVNNNYPNPFQIERIDTASGLKNDLFIKSNEWLAKTLNSAKDVIQMQDKEAGKLIAKGIMKSQQSPGLGSANFYINYTLTIDTKDRKYRIILSDFFLENAVFISPDGTHHLYSYGVSLNQKEFTINMTNKYWNNIKGDAFKQSQILCKNFNEAMNLKNDNW